MLNILQKADEIYADHNMVMEIGAEWLHEIKELRRRKFRKLLEQRYELEQCGELLKSVKHEIDSNKQLLKEAIAKKHNNGWLWVTINPKPDVSLESLVKIAKKLQKRAFVDECMWVVEQRGHNEETLGKGIHVHMLIKRKLDYKPYKCMKYLRNGCKKIVGNINNDNHVFIKVIGDEYAKDKIMYMSPGGKNGDGKDKKQDMDVIYRKNQGLEPFYGEIKSLSIL